MTRFSVRYGEGEELRFLAYAPEHGFAAAIPRYEWSPEWRREATFETCEGAMAALERMRVMSPAEATKAVILADDA